VNTLLIKNARCVASFDSPNPDQSRELRDATIFIRGHLVTPGLINTHHHMFQSLTRAIPQVKTPNC
jgi:cytosine/adenosine deaminase-related metal-dependent hydrolase